MHWFNTVAELADWRNHASNETIGLVPTMGNLHVGHRALLEAAAARCDRVVASIFVNPLQFGPEEDLETYPRTPDADRQLLAEVGVDAVFAPSVAQMYPHAGQSPTRIHVDALSHILCGQQRPGHFEGVATVVTKLLNMVRPDIGFFGEKDYQQLVILQRVVTDLCMDVEIVGVPTVREADGLAVSSRNQYLQPDQRRIAPQLAATLRACMARLEQGERNFAALERDGFRQLRDAGLVPDYFAIRTATLGQPTMDSRELRVLAAATLGRARLIDNMGLIVSS